jgi:hypothetical protein
MAKAKGTTLLSLVKLLRSQRQSALDLLTPELHHYFDADARIHASSWYPESDLLALLRATLALIPGSRDENLARMGAAVAREHMEGVYGHLRSEDAASLVRRSVALWGSQHDTGSFHVEMEAPGRATYAVREYGLPSREMCAIFKAYFAEWLRASGWIGVAVIEQSCVLDGASACAWEVTWIDGEDGGGAATR